MVADLNVHWDIGADGEAKPHAHVMLTTRKIGEDGFGAKVRDWNRTDLLQARKELEQTDISIKFARNQRLPAVNAIGNITASAAITSCMP